VFALLSGVSFTAGGVRNLPVLAVTGVLVGLIWVIAGIAMVVRPNKWLMAIGLLPWIFCLGLAPYVLIVLSDSMSRGNTNATIGSVILFLDMLFSTLPGLGTCYLLLASNSQGE
jgi:hypothetical protein